LNKTGKTVVITAPNSVKWMSKIFLTFLFLTTYLYTFSLYANPSFIIFSAETEYLAMQVYHWFWYALLDDLVDISFSLGGIRYKRYGCEPSPGHYSGGSGCCLHLNSESFSGLNEVEYFFKSGTYMLIRDQNRFEDRTYQNG
jgi:hypothetical protein